MFINLAMELLILALLFWPDCLVGQTTNAQYERSPAQFCLGASAVKPPMVPLQTNQEIGSILPGAYTMVICAIDGTGKYSSASHKISAFLSNGDPSSGITITPIYWSANTAGYELFIGTEDDLLTSYFGPKMLGPSMPTLPNSITVSSIPIEELPPGIEGLPYSRSIGASARSLIAGELPPGLSFNDAGVLNGTPTSHGTFIFSAEIRGIAQQFVIEIQRQLGVSQTSLSYQVQNQKVLGAGYMIVTVSGDAQGEPVTLTETQDWIIATVQTATSGAAAVCCPTTIVTSVDPYALTSPGARTGSLTINVPGFNPATIDYSVDVLAPKMPPPPSYDPTIQLKSVVNAASFGPNIAVGSLVSLFGINMAGGTYSASKLPLPTNLGDAAVVLCQPSDVQMTNCVATPVIYASPAQINFLAPSQPANRQIMLSVFRAGHLPAAPLSVQFLTAAPATFLVGFDCSYNPLWNDPSPCGVSWTHYTSKQPLRGAVTDQAGNLVTSSNPARLGQQYTIWPTGMGIFSGSKPPLPVRIVIGGTPTNAFYDVKPSYVGPSPQFQGLYQINFPWPDGLMGSIATLDIQACADYKMEISFNLYEGSALDPSLIQVPLLVRSGEVPCPSK